MAMDPEYSLQDVVRCHLCETPVPPFYCDRCKKYLCKCCKEKHVSNESKEHKLVHISLRRSSTKCQNHSFNICENYCEQCAVPVCVQCVFSEEHNGHSFIRIMETLESLKQIIQLDLDEFEKSIVPSYREFEAKISGQKKKIRKNTQKLTRAIDKHGQDLQREIHTIMQQMKSDLNEMDCKCLSILNEKDKEIRHTISEITQIIPDLKILLTSQNISIVSTYKSRIDRFRKLPLEIKVSLPVFTPFEIKDHNIEFGSLSVYQSEIISELHTKFGLSDGLLDVSCLNDDKIWMCGKDKIMRLYNLQGELLNSIPTKSGNDPWNITLTKSGDLVYSDYSDRTVNIVKNKKIQTVIRLQGWSPRGVCSTSSDDLLVVMDSDDKQTKVVRFSGPTRTQTIQYDNNGIPLYSPGVFKTKYICENKNLDICVSDTGAHAMVVVDQTGKLRFTYTGYFVYTKIIFYPRGITTDSQSRILIADSNNHCIHVIDKDGNLIHIVNCPLQKPFGLCVDTNDNLVVAENNSGRVKRIQYCKCTKYLQALQLSCLQTLNEQLSSAKKCIGSNQFDSTDL